MALDDDLACISYEYEPIQIEYINEKGIKSIYLPDFIAYYNDNITKVIEVKPAKLMKIIPDNLLKQKAAIKFCRNKGYEYEFWNEVTLNIPNIAYMMHNELYYKTYEEFKNRIKELGIKSSTKYKKRYKEDSMLPSHPSYVYPLFKSWYEALGKIKKITYKTYQKAKNAVQKLNIKNKKEYYKRYKEDPMLSCSPEDYYVNNGWEGYVKFLRTERNYYSYIEAKKITREMKLHKVDEYKKRYKNDIRLPSKPERIYKSYWTGW